MGKNFVSPASRGRVAQTQVVAGPATKAQGRRVLTEAAHVVAGFCGDYIKKGEGVNNYNAFPVDLDRVDKLIVTGTARKTSTGDGTIQYKIVNEEAYFTPTIMVPSGTTVLVDHVELTPPDGYSGLQNVERLITSPAAGYSFVYGGWGVELLLKEGLEAEES